MAGKPIKVLVADDDPFMRALIRRILGSDPRLSVIGTARDGLAAVRQIAALRPDVVSLDLDMPRLNGLGVLRKVMSSHPTPVVVLSAHTGPGAQATVDALALGAIDCVAKLGNAAGSSRTKASFSSQLVQAVMDAAGAHVWRESPTRRTVTPVPRSARPTSAVGATDMIVAIGISAGGPQTLRHLLPAFPAEFAPIVITQHIPAQFSDSLARSLDRECALTVKEATSGEALRPGFAYVAPGSHHMLFERTVQGVVVRLDGGPLVSGHRPSVDAMFSSLARTCGSNSVAIVMTGMGADGTQGIRELKAAGAITLAQDEDSSIVYGMPKAAAESGCVDQVVPLRHLPVVLERALRLAPAGIGPPMAGAAMVGQRESHSRETRSY